MSYQELGGKSTRSFKNIKKYWDFCKKKVTVFPFLCKNIRYWNFTQGEVHHILNLSGQEAFLWRIKGGYCESTTLSHLTWNSCWVFAFTCCTTCEVLWFVAVTGENIKMQTKTIYILELKLKGTDIRAGHLHIHVLFHNPEVPWNRD